MQCFSSFTSNTSPFRPTVNSGLLNATSPMSSVNSSQDSLHKAAAKKKGFKSSLGRFFSKKEKAKSKEALNKELMVQGNSDFEFSISIMNLSLISGLILTTLCFEVPKYLLEDVFKFFIFFV